MLLKKKVFGQQENVPNKVRTHFIPTKFGQIVFSSSLLLIQTKRQFLTLVKRLGITTLKQLLGTIKRLRENGKNKFSVTVFEGNYEQKFVAMRNEFILHFFLLFIRHLSL